MTARYTILIFTSAMLLFLQGAILSAYEPTYNEMLVKRERLESFCKLADNQRKYDICERYKSIKGKLPDRIDEIIVFRKIYEKDGK